MPVRKQTSGTATAKQKGKKLDDVLKDVDFDSIINGIRRSVNFDAHAVTEICIRIGTQLTGTSLYLYQRDTAYSILYALLTFDNAMLTMLFSRQSGKTETLAFCINTASVVFP